MGIAVSVHASDLPRISLGTFYAQIMRVMQHCVGAYEEVLQCVA